MRLTRSARRLLFDTEGQVLLFGVLVLAAVLAFMLVIPNGTQIATQKVRAQTAADVGAFTGSVWLARALNLNANMNIGIKSVYEWMTVLTMGSALSQALYSDTFDTSVMDMGRGLAAALFGNNDPSYVTEYVYPQAVRKLDTTARWLYALQDDISASFHEVAAALGTDEASRNAGAYPASEAAGGRVLVRTNDTIPLLVRDSIGDALIFSDLVQLGAVLDSIPTNDSNIGPATGIIKIDSSDFEIKAYYGFVSEWFTLTQALRPGQTIVNQWYAIDPVEPDTHHFILSAHRYFVDHKDPGIHGSTGKSWIGRGVDIWFIDSLKDKPGWRCYGKKSYSIPHPGDTVWAHQRHWKIYADSGWGPLPPGDTADEAWPWIDSGYEIILSGAFDTDFFAGADSTTGNQGAKVPIRRVNPDREFHAVSYVWRQGAAAAPFGPGPTMGRWLFPRTAVASPSPLFSVARSEPYLAGYSITQRDYYFSPAWDVRLTPLDSTGTQEVTGDAEYAGHSQNSFNLEDLRKYVLLP